MASTQQHAAQPTTTKADNQKSQSTDVNKSQLTFTAQSRDTSHKRSPYTDTAALILIQAWNQLFQNKDSLLSINYTQAMKAEVTVTHSSGAGQAVTAEQLQRLEQLANEIITNNQQLTVSSSLMLSATLLDSTEAVEALQLLKTKNRSKLQQYEIGFAVGKAAKEALEKQEAKKKNSLKDIADSADSNVSIASNTVNKKDAKTTAPSSNSQSSKRSASHSKSLINETALDILNAIIQPHLKQHSNSNNNNTSTVDEEVLLHQLERKLTMFSNQCYTAGFHAVIQPVTEFTGK